MGRRKGEIVSDIGVGAAWKQLPTPIVITDGSIGVGQHALRAARIAQLSTGGFGAPWLTNTWPDHSIFGVIPIRKLATGNEEDVSKRLCVASSHATLIFARDPRNASVSFLISTCKERRRPCRVVLDLTNPSAWQEPLQWLKEQKAADGKPASILHIGGQVPFDFAPQTAHLMANVFIRWKVSLNGV